MLRFWGELFALRNGGVSGMPRYDATTAYGEGGTMKFGHVNVVARDWRGLVEFYCSALGCVPVGVERDLATDWISRSAGVAVRIRGRHVRLPGYGDQGPTLEIFSYEPLIDSGMPMPNRTGFGHLAFIVEDVNTVLEKVIAFGGSKLGEPSQGVIEGAGTIELVYCRDPEGNVIELQKWS